MIEPSEEQKAAVIHYLDGCEPSAWLAFVRWSIDRIVRDDQKMAVRILLAESDRRVKRWNDVHTAQNQKQDDQALAEVMTDVGVRFELAN